MAAMAAGVWLGQRLTGGGQPPELAGGTVLEPAKPVSAFHLVTHEKQPFGAAQLRGHWTFAFFGYTHCPDVCPSTMGVLKRTVKQLSEHQPQALRNTNVIFVSVDPERDTPEILAQYVPYFHKDFIGVTGPSNEIAALTRQLGIMYARSEGSSEDDYLVDHSANILLFDEQGRVRAVFFAPHTAGNLASDYLRIRHRYGG